MTRTHGKYCLSIHLRFICGLCSAVAGLICMTPSGTGNEKWDHMFHRAKTKAADSPVGDPCISFRRKPIISENSNPSVAVLYGVLVETRRPKTLVIVLGVTVTVTSIKSLPGATTSVMVVSAMVAVLPPMLAPLAAQLTRSGDH